MTELEMWSAIVGFLLPPVLSVIQQTGWSPRLRAVVAFVGCLVAAAGTVLIQGGWTWERWVEASLLTLVTALATYRNLWKPTGISPAIEQKTNV